MKSVHTVSGEEVEVVQEVDLEKWLERVIGRLTLRFGVAFLVMFATAGAAWLNLKAQVTKEVLLREMEQRRVSEINANGTVPLRQIKSELDSLRVSIRAAQEAIEGATP